MKKLNKEQIESIRLAVINKLQRQPDIEKTDLGYVWHIRTDLAMRNLADDFLEIDVYKNEETEIPTDTDSGYELSQSDFDYDGEKGTYIFYSDDTPEEFFNNLIEKINKYNLSID